MMRGVETNYFKVEMQKGMMSWRFTLSVVVIGLLLYLTSLRFHCQSVVESLHMLPVGGIGGMVIWAIASIPHSASICDELEERFLFQILLRVNRLKYQIFKQLSVFIIAFVTMFLGFYLFICIQMICLPVIHVGFENIGLYGKTSVEQPYFYILLYGIQISVMAGALALVAAMSALMIRNRVLIYIIPVVYLYFQDMLSVLLLGNDRGIYLSLLRSGYFSLNYTDSSTVWLVAYIQILLTVCVICILFNLIFRWRVEHG